MRGCDFFNWRNSRLEQAPRSSGDLNGFRLSTAGTARSLFQPTTKTHSIFGLYNRFSASFAIGSSRRSELAT